MFTCTVLFRIYNAETVSEAAELWWDFGCEDDFDEGGDVREAGPATAPEPDDLGSFQVEHRFLIVAYDAHEAEAVFERNRQSVQQ